MVLFRYGETAKMQKDDSLPKFSKCVFISSSVAENYKNRAEKREYEKEKKDNRERKRSSIMDNN